MSDEYTIAAWTSEQTIGEWKILEPFFAASLDQDAYTLMTTDDILKGIETGHMTAWEICEGATLIAAFATEIVSGGKGSAVSIVAMSGTAMEGWIVLFDETMMRYVADQKCRYVIEMGRKGWTPILKEMGWITPGHVMLKLGE